MCIRDRPVEPQSVLAAVERQFRFVPHLGREGLHIRPGDIGRVGYNAVSYTHLFTRAAQALSLTQPAVSHHISQLEQELGVRLFVRGNGDLILTPEGETVLRYVRRMKALEKKMAEELQEAGRRLTRLRIGITHTAESSICLLYTSHEDGRLCAYAELADTLPDYVHEMGYNYLELTPLMEYSFDGARCV